VSEHDREYEELDHLYRSAVHQPKDCDALDVGGLGEEVEASQALENVLFAGELELLGKDVADVASLDENSPE
jgi:hypothetical protein